MAVHVPVRRRAVGLQEPLSSRLADLQHPGTRTFEMNVRQVSDPELVTVCARGRPNDALQRGGLKRATVLEAE